MDNKLLCSTIDHTLLKPATTEAITQLCQEAMQYQFASVCVLPDYVSLCAKLLNGSGVKVCTVIGFPLGENTTATKVFETADAVANGASEIDMVINLSLAKRDEWELVEQEIGQVVHAVAGKALVKVIIESCLLTSEQIVKATKAVRTGGAQFAKTSTGFSTGGATVEAVKLMVDTLVDSNVLVKASGGVRTREQAIAMIEVGASRLGTSNGIVIVSGEGNANSY